MRLHLKRAQKWSSKCMKLEFRNTDKNTFCQVMDWQATSGVMASGCVSNTVTSMNIITVTHTFLTSDKSIKECLYTRNFFLLSGFLFSWDWLMQSGVNHSVLFFFPTWIVLELKCLTYRYVFDIRVYTMQTYAKTGFQ